MIKKLLGIVVLLVSATPFLAWAGNSYLNGSGVTNNATVSFTNAAQWSAGVPGATDDACFTNAVTPFNVTFPFNVTNADAVFNPSGADTINIKVASGGQTWYLTNSLIVGQSAGANPTVQINAAMRAAVTNVNSSGTEIVGASGAGTLGVLANATNVANQIVLGQNAGSTGTLSLAGGLCAVSNGAGTGWLQVGSNGVGVLTLNGGGLTADGWSVATTNPGSAGTVTWNAGSKVTIGGVTDSVTIVTNLLGTSWGYNLCQSLVLNTNIPGTIFYPNGFTLGEATAGNGSLALNGGTFVATNAGGNATLRVGANGVGNLTFGGVAKVTLDSLALATNVGSQASLTWNPGATVTIGGNAEPAANIGNILGTSFGRTSKQTLTVNTNVTAMTPSNGVVLGETATGTGVLNVAAGTLVATNASGTGAVTWGSGGGMLVITGGAVVADHVWVPSGTNAALQVMAGSLTTTGNSTLATNTSARVVIGASGAAVWTLLGGTNIINTSSNVALGYGNGSQGNIIVVNSNTLLQITATSFTEGADQTVQPTTRACGLSVSNGAQVVMNVANVFIGDGAGNPGNARNNTNIVSGAGSQWVISGNMTLCCNKGDGSNLLVVTSGGLLTLAGALQIGYASDANWAIISGTGSVLNAGSIGLALDQTTTSSKYDSLTITDGAVVNVTTGALTIGMSSFSGNSTVTVNNASCYVTNAAGNLSLIVGNASFTNSLVVTNGGIVMVKGTVVLGTGTSSKTNNQIVVSGMGSRLDVTRALTNGMIGVSNQITIADSGIVTASNLIMGVTATSLGNLINVNNGSLYVTNLLDVARLGQGIVTLNGGLVQAGQMNVTNATSQFVLNGGTLSTPWANVNNGALFVVGDGTDAATMNLMGGTAHRFANGLFVNTNATLLANNTGVIGFAVVTGNVTLAQGSVLSLDVTATNRDAIAVVGTLTLPAQATITVSTLDGSTPWNITNVLSATSLAVATDLSGWTVSGGYYAHTVGNAVVLTQKTRGTTLMLR